jgi:type IV secretion system protein TrbG
VAIIDDVLARQLWPHGDALGKKINVSDSPKGPYEFERDWLVVIGVVRHIQNHSLTVIVRPQAYVPFQLAPRPTIDGDGWVTYTYGRGIPVVIACPLHLATVRLQKGEFILPDSADLVGDPDIKVLPRTFGTGNDQQTFVLIKPKNAGVSSDIVFGTNKRLYTIRVLVKPFDYTPRVAFTYPDDEQREAWEEYQRKQQAARSEDQASRADENAQRTLEALDTTREIQNTNYVIKVKHHAAYMRPTAVWDDGVRTHIQLPEDVATRDLPIPKTYSVKGLDSPNYRYDRSKLIIDAIFERCELLSGTGRRQQKVIIINKNKPEEVRNARR